MFSHTSLPGGAVRALRIFGIAALLASLVAGAGPASADQLDPSSPVPHIVTVKVAFEGQSAIKDSGPDRIIRVVLVSDIKPLLDAKAVVKSDGVFEVDMTGKATGVYKIWVKEPRFLANIAKFEYAGISTTVDAGTLLAGDANNDNHVTITDFNILRNTFGKQLGELGYDSRADYNVDDVVNLTDYNLARGKMGFAGAVFP